MENPINNGTSTKDSNVFHTMHVKSKNIAIFAGYETDKIVEELFDSLLQKYSNALEKTKEGSALVFDSVDALNYKLHKTNLNRGRSYKDSPE